MKMSDEKLDKLFEKMSTEAANKMNGTRPPKARATKQPAKKSTVSKKAATNKKK